MLGVTAAAKVAFALPAAYETAVGLPTKFAVIAVVPAPLTVATPDPCAERASGTVEVPCAIVSPEPVAAVATDADPAAWRAVGETSGAVAAPVTVVVTGLVPEAFGRVWALPDAMVVKTTVPAACVEVAGLAAA